MHPAEKSNKLLISLDQQEISNSTFGLFFGKFNKRGKGCFDKCGDTMNGFPINSIGLI